MTKELNRIRFLFNFLNRNQDIVNNNIHLFEYFQKNKYQLYKEFNI